MTTTIIEEPRVVSEPIVNDRPGVSWGALFAGAIVAVATWILLYAVGIAAGLSSIDPNDASSAKAAGVGTGIWSIIAPLIALFVGGFVAARLADPLSRGGGVLHGVVVWALTSIAGILAIGMVVSNLVGAVYGVGSKALGLTTGAASAAAEKAGEKGTTPLASLGLDTDDLLAPANRRLAEQGLPPVTADQVGAATKDALSQMLTQGRFDRAVFVSALASNTALNAQEANQLAQQVESKFVAAKSNVKQTALAAADKTGKAFWGISAALFLGLISAVLGAAVGSGTPRRRRLEEDRAATKRTVTVGT